MALLEVRDLHVSYGAIQAVQGVSFEVNEGEVVALIGSNGAGKSTTMNIITGCFGATEGEVFVDGHSVSEEPMLAKQRIGYLPEQPPLYMDMTPAEYLKFVATAKRIPLSGRSGQIDSVMEKTGIKVEGE